MEEPKTAIAGGSWWLALLFQSSRQEEDKKPPVRWFPSEELERKVSTFGPVGHRACALKPGRFVDIIFRSKESVNPPLYGAGGIRTHETDQGLPRYKLGAIDHSATAPIKIPLGQRPYPLSDRVRSPRGRVRAICCPLSCESDTIIAHVSMVFHPSLSLGDRGLVN